MKRGLVIGFLAGRFIEPDIRRDFVSLLRDFRAACRGEMSWR